MSATVRVRNRERVSIRPPETDPQVRTSRQLQIIYRNADELHEAKRRPRIAGKDQIAKLQTNIERFGCVIPIPVTPDREIIGGHNVWLACRNLGVPVPTVSIEGLADAEIRALRLALNKLAELSHWDDEILREELATLFVDDPDLALFTGFDAAEIDARLFTSSGLDDEMTATGTGLPILGKPGDKWTFEGGHRLLQGNSRDSACFEALCELEVARALISDIPYGCKIKGHASGSHEDFLDGADLSTRELRDLCMAYFTNCRPHVSEGALAYTFMDGRGLNTLMNAAAESKMKQVALCVWDKVNPGMGSFYRQQAEFIQVAKFDDARHLNNVALGKNRRNRSNVMSYPGLAGFGKGRDKTIAMHPTVKPIGLIADLILDCTQRGDVVLDPFAGSGTILLAAARTSRRAFAIELDPKFVDVAVHRMKQMTGGEARLEATGETYAVTMEGRSSK